MNIGIVGATGKAGSLILDEAVNRGHDVTAIVRNASKLTNDNVSVIEKDVHDLTREDFKGLEVVVNAFGAPLGEKDAHVEAGRALINALAGTGTRLIVADGAKVVTGGKKAETDKGFFYEPTILTNVTHDSKIMRDEIFGPVLPITTFETIDEAIEMANDTIYGLSSSLYSNDMNETMKVINEMKFGETYVNRENFEAVQGYHAGMRQSGLGGTDGKHGVEDFLVTQVVYMQYKNE